MSTTDTYRWVKGDTELQSVCEQWLTASVLAIDTEFVRTDTFHANLGLLQICHEQTIWLIDPLSIEDWSPFAKVLSSESIVKVLHSLSEDSEVLLHSVGVQLVNVFDSQIAAGFLGYPIQMSYAKLVEDIFDVVLPKEATRSDWLKRPLADEQCQYAAADVYWLYKIYHLFETKLNATGRYSWVVEDSQRMVSNNLPIEADQYYQKLRGAWKLKGSRLQALKELCQWREGLARSTNCNRGRILHDKDLIILAERMPKNKTDLQKYLKLPSRKIRLYGDQIIHMVNEAENVRRDDWPDRIDGPLPADQAELLKQVREVVTTIADKQDLPAELLARRKGLEAWLRSGSRSGEYAMPSIFEGWRRELLLEPINELLSAQREALNET